MGVASMNPLLAILITVGLIFNSGTGIIAAAYGKTSMGAMGRAQAHPALSQHTMHTHRAEMGNCHKHSSQSPAHGCKCCYKNAKCTHESCACLKCFSALADIRPISHTGSALATLPGPATFDKPLGSVHQPPAPASSILILFDRIQKARSRVRLHARR